MKAIARSVVTVDKGPFSNEGDHDETLTIDYPDGSIGAFTGDG